MNGVSFEDIYRDAPVGLVQELRDFRTTHPIQRLTVGGAEWEYSVGGQGREPLLLLPGGTRVGEAFQTIRELEQHHRVIVPTYPLVSTMRDLVAGLAALLDTLGVEQAHIMGASLGGMVAQCCVRAYPDRVATLILSNTGAPAPAQAAALARRYRRTLRLIRWLPWRVSMWLSEQRLAKLFKSMPEGDQRFWRAYFRELLTQRVPKAWFICQYELLLDYTQNYHFSAADLAGWPGAALIIESSDDQLIPAPLREAVKAAHPQAQVHTFANAGHAPIIGQREVYMDLVVRFLREHRSTAVT